MVTVDEGALGGYSFGLQRCTFASITDQRLGRAKAEFIAIDRKAEQFATSRSQWPISPPPGPPQSLPAVCTSRRGVSSGPSPQMPLPARMVPVPERAIWIFQQDQLSGRKRFWRLRKWCISLWWRRPFSETLQSVIERFEKAVQRMRTFKDIPEDKIRSIAAPTLVVCGDVDVMRPEHTVHNWLFYPVMLPDQDARRRIPSWIARSERLEKPKMNSFPGGSVM